MTPILARIFVTPEIFALLLIAGIIYGVIRLVIFLKGSGERIADQQWQEEREERLQRELQGLTQRQRQQRPQKPQRNYDHLQSFEAQVAEEMKGIVAKMDYGKVVALTPGDWDMIADVARQRLNDRGVVTRDESSGRY